MRGSVSRGSLLLLAGMVAQLIISAPAQAIVDKPFIEPITTEPAIGTRADVEADKITYNPETHVAVATGTVRLVYGPYVLVATRVSYDQDDDSFDANGSVELREPNGNILQAETMALRNKFKEGFARHVKALLTNDVTITADYVKRSLDGITVYENAHYTACKDCSTDGGDPLWEIVTDETHHDAKAKNLYHYNPRLKIGGVTVLGLPYAEQADPTVKRRSGWLLPDFKHGDHYGFGVVAPYFLALAPNYDLTFRPVLTTKQGPVADVEWRHRLETGQYNVRAYGVYELTDETVEDDLRGAITSHGQFALNEDWNWGWNGTLVSDRNFLDHYDFDERNMITSDLSLTGLWDRNYVSAQALHFQTMETGEDQTVLPVALPYINGEHVFENQVFGGELGLNWSIYSLSRDNPDTPFTEVNHGTSQTRAVADLNWKSQMVSDMGTVITPFARLRSDVYISNNVPDLSVPGGYHDSEATARLLPSVGVDMRMPFVASTDSGQSILSPVFQLISASDESDEDVIGNEDAITLNFDHSNLFLGDRFTGLDRYEGGTRANAGLTYTFLGANGGFVRASAGESFHIWGENSFDIGSGLDGTQSDLVGAIVIQPQDWFSLSYQARVEEDLSTINRQEGMLNYNIDRLSGSFGYLNIAAEPLYGRLADDEIFTANASFALSEGWNLFGGLRYDLKSDIFRSKTAGVEFDCDCMNFKLAYTESEPEDSTEMDRTLMMSIELRTIGKTSVSAGF